jgi:hypothetical protein
MYADDIDFQAAGKRNDVMDFDRVVFVATVTDEMNAHGRRSVVREGLVVLVTTQMSLYSLEKHPRQAPRNMKHHRSNLHHSPVTWFFQRNF